MGRKVKRVGLAERWLNKKRGGRIQMELTLDTSMINILNLIVREPEKIEQGGFKTKIAPYSADGEVGARRMIALQKWLENYVFHRKVMTESNDVIDFDPEKHDLKDPKLRWSFVFLERDTRLSRGYADDVKSLLKHYEAIGKSPKYVEGYWKLWDALHGREFEVADVMDDADDELEKDLGEMADDALDEIKKEKEEEQKATQL